MTDRLITTTEAAEILGISTSRVRQFIIDGRLQSTKLGRDQFLKQADVEDFASKPRERTGRPKTNMS